MSRSFSPRSLLVALTMLLASSATARAGDDGAVLATVDGTPITEAEVRKLIQGKLIALEAQIYDAKKEGVEAVITNRLLEREAKARNTTSEKLLAEVDNRVPTPTAGEIEALYEQAKDQIQQPLEAVRELIVQDIRANAIQSARQEYGRQLRAKAKITMNLQAPVVSVPGSGPSRGPATAPVTIIEFSDYQCPFCAQADQAVEQVLKAYKDQVRFVFRDFPLTEIHPNAQKAAEAARCAGDQGKYWEYHGKLFQNQKALEIVNLEQFAADLQLDQAKFKPCLSDGKHARAVQDDIEAGTSVGVTGTPAFFVNGRFYSGALPFESFKQMIDEILKQKKSGAIAAGE